MQQSAPTCRQATEISVLDHVQLMCDSSKSMASTAATVVVNRCSCWKRTVASSEMCGWGAGPEPVDAPIQKVSGGTLLPAHQHLSGRAQKKQGDHLDSGPLQLISQSILKWFAASVSAY